MRKLHFIILFLCLFLNGVNATDVPVEHQRILNSALLEAFNVPEAESIERLLKGMSSPGLYKISIEGKAYVVRFSNSKRSLTDKQRELEAMLIASERGLAPNVIYANVMDGIIIMDFIDASKNGRTFSPLSEESLKLLGTGMRQIHEGPVFGERASFFDFARYFENLMGEEKPSLVKKASILLDQLQLDLKDILVEKPCHHDLNPNNILYSEGKIYFIDWELAGQGDPFFDLATPLVLYGMDQNQEKIMLHAYFERELSEVEISKFQKMKSVAMIYYGFALVGISRIQGEDFASEDEIQSLPSLNEMRSDGEKVFPKGMQRFGLALLRQALRDLSYHHQ